MRFAAPDSESPRRTRPPRRASTYGMPTDSDDESSSDEAGASSSQSESSSESEPEAPVAAPATCTKRVSRSVAEQHNLEDMLAAIRLRVSHTDAYEEWAQQTRKDAFLSARHQQALVTTTRRQGLGSSQTPNELSPLQHRQMNMVNNILGQIRSKQRDDEGKWRQQWQEVDRRRKDAIERAIKLEEERANAKAELERRKKAEEEQMRQAAEAQAKAEQERQQAEREAKEKEEQERQKQEAAEEEERQRIDNVAQMKAEQEKAEADQRKALGTTTVAEDWKRGRDTIVKLKLPNGPMKTVKGNPEYKPKWNANRRAITPKVGQITNDPEVITRVTKQLLDIVKPATPLIPSVYFATLSSLSKAILLQAETEVTAEKRSAIPLAQVTANILSAVDHFGEIFWGKFCQRAGAWPVPAIVPDKDTDGTPFDPATKHKVMGYREHETPSDYLTRISGLMRVYFHIMASDVGRPLDQRYRMPRLWTYIARLTAQPALLESHIAAEIMFIALDVNGQQGFKIWGKQWTKMLATLYDGCTIGIYGSEGRLIGGKSPEGVACRTRLRLEIEKLMAANSA